MNLSEPRPFNAATNKFAYAQAFTKPALQPYSARTAHRRVALPRLTSLVRLIHH